MATSAPRKRKIRPPIGRRLREGVRRSALLVVWVGAAVGAWFLYQSSPEVQSVRAVAETVEFRLSTALTARITAVPVVVGEHVESGDLVAVLDPDPLTRELAILSAELEARHADLTAKAMEMGRQRLFEERSFAGAVDAAEVALIQARVERDAVKAELAGVRGRLRRQKALVAQRMAAGGELERLRSDRQVFSRRAELLDDAVEGLQAKLADARARLEAFRDAAPSDEVDDPAAEAALAPNLAAVRVARARLAELEAQRERLLIRAPTDGVVHRVLLRPGDVVAAGQSIAVIRTLAPTRVLAYVDDARARQIRIGSYVTILDRSGSWQERSGRVISLGSGLAPYPSQLQTLPNRQLWGREVVIQIDDLGPAVADLVPGQVLDVRFVEPDAMMAQPALAGPTGAEGDSPPRVRAAPRPVHVPPALRRRTRVEPSALVWSRHRGRYLVASDDTGYRDAEAHAPWLLVMDETGTFAQDPLVVEDLRALNDVESMGWLDDDRLLLLSSLSASRRGRRPRSRTLLVAVAVDDMRLRATAELALADLITRHGTPAWRASLGLAAEGDALDARLDIEGMAIADGALLLGLKEPLGEGGCALVWRLAHVEQLFVEGQLTENQLSRLACLRLSSEAPGGSRFGGISDLLHLPDGRVVVLSSDVFEGDVPPAPNLRTPLPEPSPAGALWIVPAGALDSASAQPVEPRLVRRFEGARPEGVALTPDGQRLTVVFDRGGETPLWTSLPLPKAATDDRDAGDRR